MNLKETIDLISLTINTAVYLTDKCKRKRYSADLPLTNTYHLVRPWFLNVAHFDAVARNYVWCLITRFNWIKSGKERRKRALTGLWPQDVWNFTFSDPEPIKVRGTWQAFYLQQHTFETLISQFPLNKKEHLCVYVHSCLWWKCHYWWKRELVHEQHLCLSLYLTEFVHTFALKFYF